MATFHQLANNAVGTIQSNPLTNVATSVIVNASLDAILSPLVAVGPVYVTMWANSKNPTADPGMEIGEITARTGANTYTIGRAKQSTSASQHNLGDNIGILLTYGSAHEMLPQGTVAQGAVYYIDSDLLPHLLQPGSAVTQQALITGGASTNPAWTTINSTLYKDTATVNTVTNNTEQTVASFTLPANTLSTSRSAVVSLTFPATGGSSAYGGYVELILMATGATNSQKLIATAMFNTNVGTTVGAAAVDTATGAIDSTTNQTVLCSVQLSAGGGGSSSVAKVGSLAELIA